MIDAKNQFSNVSEMELEKKDFSKNKTILKKFKSSNNIVSQIGNNKKDLLYGNTIINKVMGDNQIEKNISSKNKKIKSDSNLKFNLFLRKKSTKKLKTDIINPKKKRKERILQNNNNEEKLISNSSLSIRNSSKNSSKNTSKNNSPKRNDSIKEMIYDEKSILKNKENYKKSKFKNLENNNEYKKSENDIKKKHSNRYNNIILFNISKNKGNLNDKKKVTFFFGDDKINSGNKNKLVNQNINFETFHFSIFGVKKIKFCCC